MNLQYIKPEILLSYLKKSIRYKDKKWFILILTWKYEQISKIKYFRYISYFIKHQNDFLQDFLDIIFYIMLWECNMDH